MAGDADEARSGIARARQLMVERLRVRRPLMFAARSAAAVELLAGDLVAAEHELRAALEYALDMGERDVVSQVAAALARVLCMQGCGEKAEGLATLSRDRAPADSVPAQALWRAAQARTLACRGHHEQAERTARDAIRHTPAEMLNLRAELLSDLASVLLAAGADKEATTAIGRAVSGYERKGNLAAAGRARALNAERADA